MRYYRSTVVGFTFPDSTNSRCARPFAFVNRDGSYTDDTGTHPFTFVEVACENAVAAIYESMPAELGAVCVVSVDGDIDPSLHDGELVTDADWKALAAEHPALTRDRF